jgi:aminopeptidase N
MFLPSLRATKRATTATSSSSKRLRAARLAGLLALVATTLAAGAAPQAAPRRIVLPADVTPAAYRLDIETDPAGARFTGHVEIDIDVHRATKRVVLNAAELSFDRATLDGTLPAASLRADAKRETATFTWPRPIAPGRHLLRIDYRGPVRQQATGLFALRDGGEGGEGGSAGAASAAPMLFTQFENSDARRFVPCWDEPARKATFTLTATVAAGQTAIGNMPVAADEPLADGRHRVRFATSPRMSSYLLFFALGDFERVHRTVRGVDVGVVVRRGQAAHAAYALDAATELLAWFDDWFGIPYPLPKLDLVAGPGSNPGFGAMENWGAIFFFEQDLLVDPAVTTESDRRNVWLTISHEIAHQWFGNLVTMAWWDDLWLNEGFATWMQYKSAQRLHPEWRAELDGVSGHERAMAVDARGGTHPVILPITDVLQADGAFDTITYAKGSAVVRQLEATVGDAAFRDGVQRYLRAHAYGNTTSDDFFGALDAAAGRRVSAIAHDFTRQAGVPLIEERASRCEDGHTVATLAQREFREDAGIAPRSGRWQVPVRVAVVGGEPVLALVAGPAPQDVRVPGCGPLRLNAGQDGYFRSLYLPATRRSLVERFDTLGPADQLGLLQDTAAFARAGLVPMADWLDLIARVPPTADPAVLRALVAQLESLEELARGLPAEGPLRAFAIDRLRPVLARTGAAAAAASAASAASGPTASPGGDANLALIDERVIDALSAYGDARVIEAARARFARWREDPASLDAAARRSTLPVVALNATPEEWEVLRQAAARATSHLERLGLYELLGAARRPDVAARAIALAMTDEVPATLVTDLLQRVADRHPIAAFDAVASHWDAVSDRFDTTGASLVVPHLLDSATRADDFVRLEAFAKAHVPASARQEVRKVESGIRATERQRRLRVPELQAWLAAHAAADATAR